MKFIKSIFIVIFSIAISLNGQETEAQAPTKKPDLVLVFTKTEGFRHESIATGVKALREMGRKNNFIVLRTESSEDFNAANLPNYNLVVFLSSDEWYNFKNLNPDVTVVMKLDESSYEGGTNGPNHPIAWYHEYDGGRAYYSGGGHTNESYSEPDFRKHLLGAIEWCLGRN